MTPERETAIRAAWAKVSDQTVRLLKGRGVVRMMIRQAPMRPPWRTDPVDTPMEIATVTVTKVEREVTWSAVCEGLELATYRQDRRL